MTSDDYLLLATQAFLTVGIVGLVALGLAAAGAPDAVGIGLAVIVGVAFFVWFRKLART